MCTLCYPNAIYMKKQQQIHTRASLELATNEMGVCASQPNNIVTDVYII